VRIPVPAPLALLTLLLLCAGVTSALGPGTLHGDVGRWYLIGMYLLLPLCVVVPLVESWRQVKRKFLAVFLMLMGCLGVGFFSLVESFTAYVIWRQDPSHGPTPSDVLLRMKALHVVAVPFLLLAALACVWIMTLRLARRATARVSA
jgi:hypothetical protein